MKTTYKNSLGQFTAENNNFQVDIEKTIFNCTISRDGQVEPHISNNVRCKMLVKINEFPIRFDASSFDVNLIQTQPSWSFMAKIGSEKEFYFDALTWRECFKLASDYFLKEVDKYETLVIQREIALFNASF